jgi:2-polyprenyl-6-methoxyphenol hydroxylase-like FAD-dependent oxidoreductase
VAGRSRSAADVEADLVIGADGINSRVARILDVDFELLMPNASASIYGYCEMLGLEGYHWYYDVGASVGAIPTNDGRTCVFASVPRARFEAERGPGLERLYAAALGEVSRDLAARVDACGGPGKLRAFAGRPGYVRRSAGPGWALIGDAGYFRDPITAHGITDALRESEFLVRAILEGSSGEAIDRCAAERRTRVASFLEVTDRIAAFDWTLDEVREEHLRLSKEMKRLAETWAPERLCESRVKSAWLPISVS